MPEKLPVFDRPPVVEAMLGLRFEPVDELNMPYLGLYWESIRKQYPSTEIKAPITEGIPGAPLVEIVSTPKIRCWFIDESSSRLIQVQQDRFYYNWRKMPDSQEYPHYSPDLREKFGSEWVRFSDFLARQELPKPNVLSCEITYINHIERGEGWNDYSDLPKVFSSLAPGNSRVLASPKGLSFSGIYDIPEALGQIQIQFQPAIRQTDNKEILQLNLTARGRSAAPELNSQLLWFDAAQSFMVEAFDEFTRGPMHATWGRKERS